MPAKPSWFLHVPEIVAQLEVFDVPVVDRTIVERLFGLRRRQAIELLHRFGGYQTGRTFLIPRQQLLEKLLRITEDEVFEAETQRKERLDQALANVRCDRAALQIRIPVKPDVWRRKVDDLPAGIALQAGRLQIEFVDTEDLLSKLYELSQAAANDMIGFRAAAEPVER